MKKHHNDRRPDNLVFTTQTTIVNSPETRRQYQKDCRLEAKQEREGQHKIRSQALAKNDTEFVGRVLYIPKELHRMKLTKDDLRLLVIA